MIVVTLPEGESIRVDIGDTDGQFIISYGDPETTPAHEEYEAVRVLAELPDDNGRRNVIYSHLYGSAREQAVLLDLERRAAEAGLSVKITSIYPEDAGIQPEPGDRLRPPPGEPDFDEIMLTKSEPYSLGSPTLSIEELLRGAIQVDPETGLIPTEPGLPSESLPATPAPPTAQGPQTGSDDPLDALGKASQAGNTLPPDARPMDDTPPKDGTPIVLYYHSLGELHQEFASWSSALGRQFWVDSDGESLGMDEAFEGWRLMSVAEREEMGL